MAETKRDCMTTFINIFGGAGVGKSITASLLFAQIKLRNISAELITEYAKERVWAGDLDALKCQPYITGTQFYRQYILNSKVEYAVTDSPIPLGLIYKGFGCNEDYDKAVLYQFNLFQNINVYLQRDTDHLFEERGRVGGLEDAIRVDYKIKDLLNNQGIPYYAVTMSEDFSHIQKILDYIWQT